MASAVDSRLAYARLSAVATASRLPTANRGSNNSYTTSWDTTATTGGLAGILASGIAPAVGQTRELKVLVNSHFVPASDDELLRQMKEFGKAEGVKVRLDRVAHLQLPAVLAGEVQGQKGHDVVVQRNGDPNLYSKHLVNLDDLHEKIG